MTGGTRSLRARAFDLKASTMRASSGRYFETLLRAESMPSERLASDQRRRAREIATFAMSSSPFYRSEFARLGVDPDLLESVEHWQRLPIIDRTMVKERRAEFPTPDATTRNVRSALTGGSTGEPLQTMHDARVRSLALSWRMYSWWGVAPHDDLARMGRWSLTSLGSLKNAVAWWPTRQAYFDARLVSTESLTAFHRSLQRTRPRLIEGYVGAMLEFADFLERRGLTIPTPLAVATTAAPLTAPVRRRLEAAFGAPVYDEYRVSEFGWTAGECGQQDGLHVFADAKLIEIVDEQGAPLPPGETGEIVITDLDNRVFPLIRYRVGDRGSLRGTLCACGRTLPIMDQPQGRTMDLVRLPNGDVLAHVLTGMFSGDPDAVRLFQLHQHADFSITLRVVPGDVSDASARIERVAEHLRDRVGNAVPVRVEHVASLPYTGGKVKYIISEAPVPTPRA
jgi:phenylacetate-CoA ligase